MERIKQHKEELAKQNVPEREINLMYEKTKFLRMTILLDIQLLDHIIVGGDEYFSYADNGFL